METEYNNNITSSSNANAKTGSLFAPSSLTRHLLTSVGKHIAPVPNPRK